MMNLAKFPDKLRLGVIAGGQSSRWGGTVSKCLSNFRGNPMICSALNQLSLTVQGICIRPEQYLDWQTIKLPYPIIQESRQEFPAGPLTGIYALLSTLAEDQWLVVIPCDMPFVDDEVIEVLWQKQQTIAEPCPLVLTDATGKHTPICLLSQHHLTSLENNLLEGKQKFIRWLEDERVISVPWLGDPDRLMNMNYSEDANRFNP